MSAQGLATGFIDLATYGELEKHMYGLPPPLKSSKDPLKQYRGLVYSSRIKYINLIIVFLIIIVLKYILKNK